MAKDLRQTIESGLNIGLSPQENSHLRPTMRALAQPGYRFIAILDESGQIITEGEMKAPNQAQWKTLLAKTAPDSYWQASDQTTFQIGVPFSNNFNVKVGAILIGYDRLAIEATTGEMARKLIINLLQTLLPCSLLVFGGCYLLTHRLIRELGRVGSRMEQNLHEATPVAINEPILGQQLADEINAFTTLGHQVVHELKQLDQELAAHQAGA